MAQIDGATSRFLDATRWMAALAVVVSHASALVIAPGSSWADEALRYLQNCGHLAVVIFFVVSGYLVGGLELLRAHKGRPFDPRRYAIQRFSRIYTVLLPALAMTALFDWLGRNAFNASALYTDPAMQRVGSLMYAIADRDDPATFIGNLLMLQTILVEPFGGNGPLWSLANEWWYYVDFGLFLVAISSTRRPLRLATLGAALMVLGILPLSISVWFAIWLVGVAAALLGQRWPGLRFAAAMPIMAAGFALALLGMRFDPLLATLPPVLQIAGRLAIDAVAAIAFALGLLSARNGQPRSGHLHTILASFSYTLYAVHFPALILLAAAAHDLLGLQFNRPLTPASLAAVAALSLAIWVFAGAMAHVTERRTPAVRNWLMRLVSGTPKPLDLR